MPHRLSCPAARSCSGWRGLALALLPALLSVPGVSFAAESAAAVRLPITFTLDKPGRVSLAVYSPDGAVQVRTLVTGERLAAGEHTVAWDGLDRTGAPIPPGDYTWKLLQTQGLTAEYLLNIGTSTREHWPGNHIGLTAGIVVGDTLVMTSGNSESPVTTVALDLATGQRLASHDKVSGWNPISDLAFDETPLDLPERPLLNGHLYMTVPEEGLVHLATPQGGSILDAYYRNKFGYPTFFVPLMRLDFTDGTVPAQAGWTAAPPIAYSEARGFGWEDPADISGFAGAGAGNRSGHLIAPGAKLRTFLVDVPAGGWQKYQVTFHLGHPDKPLSEFAVYGGTSYDKPQWQGTHRTEAGDETVVTYSIMPLPGSQLRLAFAPGKDGCAIRGIEIATGPNRVDACKGKVVIASTLSGAVQEISTDARRVLATLPVPGVRDVALLADGTILALLGDRVVKVEPDRQTPIISGLESAGLLSVDRSTGELFITDGGQIKRYDAAYTLQRVSGRKGGRRQGLYVAEDFAGVTGLAPDGRGGFVVIEGGSAPRRTAHFDREGKLLREWYGGQLWATNACVDPHDDSRIWLNSHWGWLIEADVDWTNRTWKPRSTYQFQGLANGLIGGATGSRGFFRVVYRDGAKYLAGDSMNPCLLRVDEAGRRLVPVMASGLNITHYWSAQPAFIQQLLGSPQSKYRSYLWQDANGDGEPQAAEVRLSEWTVWGPGWTVADDSSFVGIPFGGNPARLLAPGPAGYPPFEQAATVTLATDASLHGVAGNDVWRDAAGNWYAVLEGAGDGFVSAGYGSGVGGHSDLWPADLSAATAFAKWDAAGALQWKVGNKAYRTDDQRRGQLHAPVRVLGEVNGCVGVGDRAVLPVEFWTTDGLYVGGLFDHRADDGLPPAYYSWWRANRGEFRDLANESPIELDMVTGGMLFQRKNGDVIYCADGYNNLPTYRITGWDQFVRRQGTIRLETAAKAAAGGGTGLSVRYASADAGKPWERGGVDPQIWLGDAAHKKPWPEGVTGDFTAVWTGFLEPRFSEAYLLRLSVGQGAMGQPEEVRLWIDGEMVFDTVRDGKAGQTRFCTAPLRLTAGKKTPMKLEYKTAGSGRLHLSWESLSQPIEHVPASALYPD